MGIRASIYLDDLKINAATKALAWKHYQITRDVFKKAVFVISVEKSDEFSDISQQKLYLGFIMDSVTMSASASSDKLSSVFSFIKQKLSCSRISVKDLARIAGRLASLRPAFGPLVLLVTRSTYAAIESHVDSFGWSGFLRISEEITRELNLFLSYAPALNGYPLLQEHRQRAIQDLLPSAIIVAGDASASAVCAYSLQAPSRFFFQDLLSDHEVILSSGHRELLTLKKALLADIIPSSSSVIWYTDSTNLASFWEKGSPKPLIQLDIIECLLYCKEHDILHLSREDPRIQAADVGSRSFDKDDWGVDDASFSVLQSRFLPQGFSVDLFASTSNARCPRFFSRYAYPGLMATDAFSMDWSDECAFITPPIGKIIPAWKKIGATPRLKGVILFPLWKTATYWPVLFPDGCHSEWPAQCVQCFDPFINLGQFYAGVMNGRNSYLFVAVFFDTSILAPATTSLCHLSKCHCF